jgi:endogenous inhibitor of DNA gyrase (YacG/DUF329 family)
MPTDNVIKLKPVRPCPICGKASVQAFHPFCSGRCADVDLHRWLSGAYVIPGPPLGEVLGDDDNIPPGALPPDDEED